MLLVEFVIIGVPDVVTGRRIFRSKTVAVSTFIGYLSLLCGLRYCSNNVGEIFYCFWTTIVEGAPHKKLPMQEFG